MIYPNQRRPIHLRDRSAGTFSAAPDPEPDPNPQPQPTTDRPVGMESPVDLNHGYEALDDNKCVEYFGIPATAPPHLVPRVLAVRSVLEEKVGRHDVGAWIKADMHEPEQPDAVQHHQD